MNIENFDKALLNILIQFLSEQQKLKSLLYETINLYSIKSFDYRHNFTIYNKITKINTNKIKIETDSNKLLEQLESNLISLNKNLSDINSLFNFFPIPLNINDINNNKGNKNNQLVKKSDIFVNNFIDKYMEYYFANINNIYLNNELILTNNNNLIILEENYFQKLIQKHILIRKYFKLLKIQYSKKIKNSKEFIQIKVVIQNICSIIIVFPSNLTKFYENNYHKKIKIVVNGLYGPSSIKNISGNYYNNYSNFKFYNKLEILFNNKFKNILKNLNEIKESEKISFYNGIIIFLDYLYDYNKIFKIKCKKCMNKLRFISGEHYFSVPYYKIINIEEKYINDLINNIEKGNDINKNFKENSVGFFHDECIYNL
jgi:hypothetical protein